MTQVRECDVALATGVIQKRLRSDVAGLKEAMYAGPLAALRSGEGPPRP